MTLQKYHEAGKEYLLFDPAMNSQPLTDALVRSFCCRNFGISSSGILVGPLLQENTPSYKLIDLSGNEIKKDAGSASVFKKYLNSTAPTSTIYYFPNN